MTQIVNKELVELDKEVGEFYKLSARYFNSLTNSYGREIYKSKLDEIFIRTLSISPESEFDSLILRNIESNLRLNDLTMEYIGNQHFHTPTKEFIDLIAGKGTWNYMENKVKYAPHRQRWNLLERKQERIYSKIDASIEEAKEAARKWLPRIKADVISYGKSKGVLPEGFDINIFLLNDCNYSYWNSKTNTFSLGNSAFDYFNRNGKVIAIPVWAYKIAFHEVLGHAAHQIHSLNLPHSITFSEEIGEITPTKSITEGVAKSRELESFNFLKQNMDDLGLNDEDISLVETENSLSGQTDIESLHASLVKERELREKGFDSYAYMLNLTQNPIIANFLKNKFGSTFIDKWKEIGHAFGNMHYNKMKKEVKMKAEDNNKRIEDKMFNLATLKGVWSWEVYPDAVSYFLRNP